MQTIPHTVRKSGKKEGRARNRDRQRRKDRQIPLSSSQRNETEQGTSMKGEGPQTDTRKGGSIQACLSRKEGRKEGRKEVQRESERKENEKKKIGDQIVRPNKPTSRHARMSVRLTVLLPLQHY